MDATGDTVVDARGTDEELVAELRDGDGDALAELFDLYGDRIHTHCFRRLGSWHEAEDATANAFLEVWRHRDRVRIHEGSALPWLYGVATNVCRNQSRGSRRRLRLVQLLPDPGVAQDHAPDVADRLDAEARMQRVLEAIRDLPEREREVLALVAWAGLTYEQAAVALAVPIGTIRSRLSRARKRLALPDPEGDAS